MLPLILTTLLLLAHGTQGLEYRNITFTSAASGVPVTLSTLQHGNTSAEAETILFLHGFPEGSWAWAQLMASGALDAYTLVAPDQRGYNRSTVFPHTSNYVIQQLASDVLGLITALSPRGRRVHLVAHDWGGAVAWWVASAAPDVLRSLTILNMPHPLGWITGVRGDPKQQEASAYVLQFVNPLSTLALTANNCAELQQAFAGDAFFQRDKEAYLSSWQVKGTVNAGLNWYRANIHPNCSLVCVQASCWNKGVSSTFDSMVNGGIVPDTVPVRVLWGMQDTAFDNDYQLAFLQKMVKGTVQITQYPNNTHWIAQESPEEMASQIATFVRKVGAV